MGINLKDLVQKKEIELKDLAGKRIAIDAYNVIYQFLAAIRQRDGTPLMDSKGRVTSHLAGLFSRTANLVEAGVKLCFVFDGQPPELKAETQQQRRLVKEAATKKYEEALKAGKLDEARKYAQQTSHLTPEMVSECKRLIEAMGLPYVQALGDGEAQAAYMAAKGQVFAVASQDYDSLLFGAAYLIRNLTISEKKRIPGTKKYIVVKPEIISLADTLNTLGIDRVGLVKAAVLIGTDFNTGVRGLGPKTALKVIKENKFEKYANKVPRAEAVMNIFLKPAITNNYILKWGPVKSANIKNILCEEHDFSESRVNSVLNKLSKSKRKQEQANLDSFA